MTQTSFAKHRLILLPGIALGTLCLGVSLVAQTRQNTPAGPVGPPPTSPQHPTVEPSGQASTAQPAAQSYDHLVFNGLYHTEYNPYALKGNDLVYTRGDSVTTADRATYKEVVKADPAKGTPSKGILDAEGNLIYDDPQHHATCNRAHVDQMTRLAVFTENVVLVLKPDKPAKLDKTTADKIVAPSVTPQPTTVRPSSLDQPPASQLASNPPPADDNHSVGAQKKHGATVTCDRMEDQYKKKYIKLYGHVIFKQRYVDGDGKTVERVLTAEHAEYNGKSEVMLLFGPVDGHDGNGQEIHSPNLVKVGTKEGQETLDGVKISIKFLPDEDKDDADVADAKDADKQPAAPKDRGGKDTSGKGASGDTGAGDRAGTATTTGTTTGTR